MTTPDDVAALGTILGVWAHPDDETYLSGSLMVLARRAGSSVVCVSATRGELGSDDPERWPPARLARTRELEAAAAMAILGVDDHRFLGYRDGGLSRIPPAAGAAVVARLLEEVQPDTVVTFGPDGYTGHADHRAVSRWTTDAWRSAGGSRAARLLYATTTASFADEFADIHTSVPVFDDGLPLRFPDDERIVRVVPDDDVADVKLAALRAQATQVAPLVARIGEERYAAWCREERFRPAGDVR